MDMQSEPIRLPALVVAVLLVVGPPVAAVLNGANPKEAIATAILGLVASGGVLGVAESRRARTDSPATIAQRFEVAAAVAATAPAGPGDDVASTSAPAGVDLSQPPPVDSATAAITLEDLFAAQADLADLADQIRARVYPPASD